MADANDPGRSRQSSKRNAKRSSSQDSHPKLADLAQKQETPRSLGSGRPPVPAYAGQRAEDSTTSFTATNEPRVLQRRNTFTTPIQHDEYNRVDRDHVLPSPKGSAFHGVKRSGLSPEILEEKRLCTGFRHYTDIQPQQQTQATFQTEPRPPMVPGPVPHGVQEPVGFRNSPWANKKWTEASDDFVLDKVPKFYNDPSYTGPDLVRDFKKGNFGFECTKQSILNRYQTLKQRAGENQNG